MIVHRKIGSSKDNLLLLSWPGGRGGWTGSLIQDQPPYSYCLCLFVLPRRNTAVCKICTDDDDEDCLGCDACGHFFHASQSQSWLCWKTWDLLRLPLKQKCPTKNWLLTTFKKPLWWHCCALTDLASYLEPNCSLSTKFFISNRTRTG